jgi:hypothetical protein
MGRAGEAQMANNDQIILDQILEDQRNSRAPTSSKPDFFEMYAAEQLLKDFDLSDDEIESGLVGAGNDGGIDGIYLFLNGDILREDTDVSFFKKNIEIDVFIIQAKTTPSFGEDAINRFNSVSANLFDLSKDISKFSTVYNPEVIGAASNFRRVYKQLAARFPTLRFHYAYVSRGDSASVHQNTARKVEELESTVRGLFSDIDFSFEFVGASNLLALARRQPKTSYALAVAESISAQGGYICLVKLGEFDKFIRDEDGNLRKHLFESNVRDYQGSTEVNDEIQSTLAGSTGDDFWWLNNGVTIIASKAVQSGKSLTIEYPQIVNGLQTSTEIYKYFSESGAADGGRSVMVRVIESDQADSRDRIIKATNSQTNIPPASLRATDKIHRDIEQYLKPFGLYYDRRKNSHKNEGRAIEQIVSIPLMAQSVMSICLGRPNDARARPSSLLKKDDDYNSIFSPSYPIEMYLVAGKIIKDVQSDLRRRTELPAKDRNNLIFYVAMHLASCLAGKVKPSASEIASVPLESITPEVIEESIAEVKGHYDGLGATDQAAKGTGLLPLVEKSLSERFAAAHPGA